MVGPIVDEERFERREEQAGGVTDARDGLSGGADGAAQFLQHKFAAGGFVATQHAALELGHEHRPRLGLERAQIVPQRSTDWPSLVIATPPHLDGARCLLVTRRLRRRYVKCQEFKAIEVVATNCD